jgi:hypothetical protein
LSKISMSLVFHLVDHDGIDPAGVDVGAAAPV